MNSGLQSASASLPSISGNFWSEVLSSDQRRSVLGLRQLSLKTRAAGSLVELSGRMSGKRVVDVFHKDFKVDPDNGYVIVGYPGERVTQSTKEDWKDSFPKPAVRKDDAVAPLYMPGATEEDPHWYWLEDSKKVVFPIPYLSDVGDYPAKPYTYLLPWEHETKPSIITLDDGSPLFAGVSFSLKDTYIEFKEDPRVLFPDGNIHVSRGYEYGTTVFPYSSSTDPGKFTGKHVNRYLRESQGIQDLESALNELIGLIPFDKSGTVAYYYYNELGEVVYGFTDGSVQVIPQQHHPVPVNTDVVRGMVPGKKINIKSRVTDGDDWVETLENANHYDLGYNAPGGQPNTFVQSVPVPVLADLIDLGDVIYGLSDFGFLPEQQQQLMFKYLRNKYGIFENGSDTAEVNDYLINEYISENKPINYFKFLLQNFWFDNGMIIYYDDTLEESEIDKVKDFVKYAGLLSSVVIYASAPTLSIVSDYNIGDGQFFDAVYTNFLDRVFTHTNIPVFAPRI